MGKERVMKKIVAQIRARYPDVLYWVIASCYKLYGNNMAQIHSRIRDIYSAFGDHPQVIWKMKENELKRELEEKMKSEIEGVDETVPIITDDGHLCCDACGCQIVPEQEVCEQCRRTISWNK